MARGDMSVKNAAFGSGAEILNRPPYEAVAMTINFDGASDTDFKKDTETGEFYAPAGIPVDKDGKQKKSTFEDIVGILLYDVYPDRPQGAVLKKAYINEKRAKDNSGVESYDELKSELPMIVFEESAGE